MSENNIINNFKKELKELLIKYNASIGFSVGEGSDTYGLYDEKIGCSVGDVSFDIADGWCFDQYDLK